MVHSLEASLWCFLNNDSYKDCVLKAVNLGEDTDTIGSITGVMGGLYYGYNDIPSEWVASLKKLNYIQDYIDKYVL